MFVVFHKLYSYLPVFLSKNNILVEPPCIGAFRTFDCVAANFLESGLYTVEFAWINLKMDKVYSCTGKRYMGYLGCKTGIWQLLGHSLQRFPNLNSLCRGSGIYGLECPAIDDTSHVCLYHLLANDSTTLEDRVEL